MKRSKTASREIYSTRVTAPYATQRARRMGTEQVENTWESRHAAYMNGPRSTMKMKRAGKRTVIG